VDLGVEATRAGAGPLDPDALDEPARLKAVLASHGFLGREAREALGAEIGPAPLRKDLPLYLRRLAASTPLNSAIKLFSLGQWLREEDAGAAVAPIPVAALEAAGLLERGPRGVRARVQLAVHRELLLAHDGYDPGKPGFEPDHVLGTNAPALTLDSMTVRKPVGRTLDLGCGGGVQSLLAARHSAQVVAVDKNPRAINFARWNARLNGVANVECREGDLFEPVAGERFDLIVCNPPYVISPESRYIFQDSGRPGDAMCQEVVQRLPDYLEEGGYATVLCNWALREGEDWQAPLRRWVEGRGADAWLLLSDTQDPLTYAAVWNRARDPSEYGDAIDRWLEYDREAGIRSIAMGAVILRGRSCGPGWIRADTLARDPEDSCSEHILRAFAAEDHLCRLGSDEQLLANAYRLVDDHSLAQTLRLREGRYAIETAEIQLSGGFRFRGAVDAYALHILQRCDGRRQLGEIVGEMVREGPERGRLMQVVAQATRRLVALGFLVPSGDQDAEPTPHVHK
jgi:SAM-dependent methyltransferase